MNNPKTMTTMIDGHYGNWQSGMFVRYDYSHVAARTTLNERWDGIFIAACPHGRMAEWRSFFGLAPVCLCECR